MGFERHNDEFDYGCFFEEIIRYEREIIERNEISPEVVEKYFRHPTWVPATLELIFEKLCEFAQDNNKASRVIDFANNHNVIRHIACNFDVNLFLRRYSCPEDVYRIFAVRFPIELESVEIIASYSKSMFDAAKLLSQFKDASDFISKLEAYEEFAANFISYNIHGFDIPLACKFLQVFKDLYLNICIPDDCLISFIREITNASFRWRGDELCYQVMRNFKILVDRIKASGHPDLTVYDFDKHVHFNYEFGRGRFSSDFLNKIKKILGSFPTLP